MPTHFPVQWTVSMTVLIGPNWESTRLWLFSSLHFGYNTALQCTVLSTWQRDGERWDITILWKLSLTFLQPARWLQHCSKLASIGRERERDMTLHWLHCLNLAERERREMTSLWKLILGTAHFVATNWKKSRPYGLISKSNSVWSTNTVVLLRDPMVDCPSQLIYLSCLTTL